VSALTSVLRAPVTALADHAWYVFGAQALRVWGAPRQTLDVDITVATPIEDVSELVNTLTRHGFTSKAGDPVGFARRYYVVPVVHVDGTPVDIIIAGTPFETNALSQAITAELYGVTVPVVSAEDLVVYKLSSDRARDHEDAASVVRRQASRLDADRIRAALRAAERALDVSDLVREFDALLAAAVRRER